MTASDREDWAEALRILSEMRDPLKAIFVAWATIQPYSHRDRSPQALLEREMGRHRRYGVTDEDVQHFRDRIAEMLWEGA